MAEWNWHVALARDVMRRVEVNNELAFILGALLPDTPWTDIDNGDAMRQHLHMSRRMDNSIAGIADVSKFLDKYGIAVRNSDVYRGWLTHIVLDAKVNDLWNLTHYMDNFDRYFAYIGENIRYTTKQLANVKWSDLSLYASSTFVGEVDYVSNVLKGELSEDDVYVLTEVVGIGDSDIAEMKSRIPVVMNQMLKHDTKDYFIPATYYSMLHNDAVHECTRLLKFVDYVSEGML